MRAWAAVGMVAAWAWAAGGCTAVLGIGEPSVDDGSDGGGLADAAPGDDAACSGAPVCLDFVTARACLAGRPEDTRCSGSTPVCEDGVCAPLGEVAFGDTVHLGGDSVDRFVITDVNGDGDPDLVSHLNPVSGESGIFIGRGDQTFLPSQASFISAGFVYGDFDHDDDADFLSEKGSFLGDGAGGFTLADPLGSGSDLNASVQLVDLDEDGDLDYVFAPTSTSSHALTIGYGVGDGTFEPGIHVSTLSPATKVLVRDVDGNGHPDLLAREDLGSVEVFLRTAARAYAPGVINSAALAPVVFLSADFDGDERADLLTVSAAEDALELRPGAGDGTFGAAVPTSLTRAPKSVGVGELNGDGRPDIVIVQRQPSLDETFVAFVGRGDFSFKAVGSNVTDLGIRVLFGIGDVDHDQRDEIFYTTSSSSQITMVPNLSP